MDDLFTLLGAFHEFRVELKVSKDFETLDVYYALTHMDKLLQHDGHVVPVFEGAVL